MSIPTCNANKVLKNIGSCRVIIKTKSIVENSAILFLLQWLQKYSFGNVTLVHNTLLNDKKTSDLILLQNSIAPTSQFEVLTDNFIQKSNLLFNYWISVQSNLVPTSIAEKLVHCLLHGSWPFEEDRALDAKRCSQLLIYLDYYHGNGENMRKLKDLLCSWVCVTNNDMFDDIATQIIDIDSMQQIKPIPSTTNLKFGEYGWYLHSIIGKKQNHQQ